jgi:hypothetical protein
LRGGGGAGPTRRMKLFLLALVIGCTSGHAQLILLHDGFESPAIIGHALGLTGPFSFGAWSGVAASHGGNAGVVSGADNGLSPAEGLQHFAFNGGNPSDRTWVQTSLSLPLTSTNGALTLNFALGRGGAVGQLLHARVQVWAGASLLLEEIAIPAQANSYTWFAFDFVSGGGDLRIRFEDVSGPNQVSDLWLDAVSLSLVTSAATGAGASAVPEATDWAQFAGFGVLGYSALRRKTKAGILQKIAKLRSEHQGRCLVFALFAAFCKMVLIKRFSRR